MPMKSQYLNARHVHSFVIFVFVFKDTISVIWHFYLVLLSSSDFKIKKGMLFNSSSQRLLKTLNEGYVQSVGKLILHWASFL